MQELRKRESNGSASTTPPISSPTPTVSRQKERKRRFPPGEGAPQRRGDRTGPSSFSRETDLLSEAEAQRGHNYLACVGSSAS